MRLDAFSKHFNFSGRREAFFLFVLAVLFLLPSIWSEASITGKDEYLLSFRTPMEMIARGSWLTPWVDGAPRLKKPPLLYWAIVSSYKAFGTNLFAARFASVLFGAGFVAVICLLYRELFGKSGLTAGLMALGSLGVATQARMALLDLPLALFATLAVYLSLVWGRTGGFKWILLAALSLGLSFLSKGPVCFLFFGTAAATALWLFGKRDFVLARAGQVFASFLLLLALCAPWPLLMANRWPGFMGVVSGEVGGRSYGSPRFFLSALGGATGLIFPWSLLFPAALPFAFRHRSEAPGRKLLWLAVWFFASALPFFFMMSFERYLLPILPAACLLASYWLEEAGSPLGAPLFRISVSLLGATALCLSAFVVVFRLGVFWPVVTILLTAAAILASFLEATPPRLSLFLSAALLSLLLGGLYPCLGINSLPRDFDRLVGGSEVAVFNSEQPSMLSIRAGRSDIGLAAGDMHNLPELTRSGAVVFMKEDDAPEFELETGKEGVKTEQLGKFGVLYSEKSWIRFARKGTSLTDLEEALKSRSLENLKTIIRCYRIKPRENHG